MSKGWTVPCLIPLALVVVHPYMHADPQTCTQRYPNPHTPMLVQYLEIKKAHPDAILFYRMGDFYEMFYNDALTAAPVLGVQLTSRDKNTDNPVPMCGVPHHSALTYIRKLIEVGHKVAICEQVENPRLAKGIVKREVTRVITPALIGDPDLASDENSQWLASIQEKEGIFELSLLDLFAGEIRLGSVPSFGDLIDAFRKYRPREVLISGLQLDKSWQRDFVKCFPECLVTVRESYFEDHSCLGALHAYLNETQRTANLKHLEKPLPLQMDRCMHIDSITLEALEILRGRSVEGPSLFKTLDKTLTSMGRRLLKSWLSQPLYDKELIEFRLDAVDNLLISKEPADRLRALLGKVRDLERLTTKAALGLALPRDLVSIRETMKLIRKIPAILKGFHSQLLNQMSEKFVPMTPLMDRLENALEEAPPANFKEGGIFKSEYHPDIEEFRSVARDTKSHIAAMESWERSRTKIPNLKIKYSKVFGYTLEVSRSYLDKIPTEYRRKQTIAGGERFVTDELKNFEEKVSFAEEKLRALEESLFLELRQQVAELAPSLLVNARLIAKLDVLLAFARVSTELGYCRPKLTDQWDLEIKDGRHPIIEIGLPIGGFIPNSVSITGNHCRTLLITGPNMAGKSTVMRQVALIVILSHVGCFVPAQSAHIPLVDAIFTRVGSSDDISKGQSTFMVEMNEISRILARATKNSLLIIDEIGRGTSTYDGLALAWALLEYTHTEIKAKTMFATHFHELTPLQNNLAHLVNFNVLVEKSKDGIVFLHKLVPGICNRSYGIEVARLAGLPPRVLCRAQEILGCLETQSQRGERKRGAALQIHDNQLALFSNPKPTESRSEID